MTSSFLAFYSRLPLLRPSANRAFSLQGKMTKEKRSRPPVPTEPTELKKKRSRNEEEKPETETKTETPLLSPVTFVTGNAKKLEEVRAIIGSSIPLQSRKLDRISLSLSLFTVISPPIFVTVVLLDATVSILTASASILKAEDDQTKWP